MSDQPVIRSQEFPYSRAGAQQRGGAVRPLLSFSLENGRERVEVSGLLDTGADVNVLPYDLRLQLGANWSAHTAVPNLSGNLGQYEARGIILTAHVGSFPPRRLAFAWTRAEGVPLILGQVNFFLEYDVCFFRSRQTFTIRPRQE